MAKRKKLILILLSIAMVAIIGGFIWWRMQKKPETRFETTKLERGRIVAKVTATGSLSALVTVQVGSQVSGTIKELFVDFNSQVKKGEILARIDPQLFEASLEQERANYIAAQGNVTKAKVQAADSDRQYQRAKNLVEKGLIAQADFDTAQANLDAAKAQVDVNEGNLAQTKAALHQAQINLGYSTIVSPINGIVISRNVDVGQTVAASLQAPTLFTIAEDLRRMQVDTSVAEADVGRLQSEMQATFTVDAYPNERFHGKVRQVRNAPQLVQNVVTYDAVIDVDNDALKLKPGMTANVTFIYSQKDNVLRLPNAALRFRPPQGMFSQDAGQKKASAKKPDKSGSDEAVVSGRTIWVLRNGKPQDMKVSLGVSDGSYTDVTENNLQEGDEIIIDIITNMPPRNPISGGPTSLRRPF